MHELNKNILPLTDNFSGDLNLPVVGAIANLRSYNSVLKEDAGRGVSLCELRTHILCCCWCCWCELTAETWNCQWGRQIVIVSVCRAAMKDIHENSKKRVTCLPEICVKSCPKISGIVFRKPIFPPVIVLPCLNPSSTPQILTVRSFLTSLGIFPRSVFRCVATLKKSALLFLIVFSFPLSVCYESPWC